MDTDKLDLKSPDLVNENFEKLAALFPNCVTESAEGKAIDFDLLRQELSHAVVEGNKERYRLEWPGKREAIVTANLPTTKTLRPVREDSVDFDNTENLYIEGDNLEVLKLLQESYLGKIKMIYIDPPYNTGKDFVYKDNFSKDAREELIASGQKDEYNQRLVANPETVGRYHSDWLSMMYPRLKLARNLLSKDGVIFISIDDNEVDNLRKVCDEIFGEDNFINTISVNMNSLSGVKMTHAINGRRFPAQKEYILLYKKGSEQLTLKIPKRPKDSWDKEYNLIIPEMKNQQFDNFNEMTDSQVNEILGKMTLVSLSEFAKSNNIELTDDWKWKNAYRIFGTKSNTSLAKRIADHSFENVIVCYTNNDGNKRYFKSDFNRDVKDPRIELVQAESNSTVFLSDNWIDISNDGGVAQEGGVIFPNGKKPLSLIERIIQTINSNEGVVLDFFSGSATTAHAAMRLNSDDQGKRKFIMVQVPEEVKGKATNSNDDFSSVCEIGKERIRRAARKIKEELSDELLVLSSQLEKAIGGRLLVVNGEWVFPEGVKTDAASRTMLVKINHLQLTINNCDWGFRVYRLDSSNMQDVYYKPQDYEQGQLDFLADNVKPERTADDLLAQVMLDWGLPLSLKIGQVDVLGKKVFKVAENSLYACFDNGIDEDFAKAIAKDKPLRIVFKDSGFKDDTAKVNVKQLLKQLSPETEMKVI